MDQNMAYKLALSKANVATAGWAAQSKHLRSNSL